MSTSLRQLFNKSTGLGKMTTQQSEEAFALGERLAKLRVALGFKAEDFAAALEISRGYLSEIENGRYPGKKVIASLRRLLPGLADYVMSGDGEYVIHGFIQGKGFSVDVEERNSQLVYIVRAASSEQAAEGLRSSPEAMNLQADEELLLDYYRAANRTVRKAVLSALMSGNTNFGERSSAVQQNFQGANVGQVVRNSDLRHQTFSVGGTKGEDSPKIPPVSKGKKSNS